MRKNWAVGLNRIRLRLESLNCPCNRADGASAAVRSLLESTERLDASEILYSNVLEVIEIPSSVLKIRLDNPVSAQDLQIAKNNWAFRKLSRDSLLSFMLPPDDVPQSASATIVESISWRDKQKVYGINAATWSLN